MIVFWLVTAVMILIALAFVLPPLWQRDQKNNAAEVKEANVAVYRDQLRELESDLGNGIVSKEQYAQDREEIERRLLEDTSDTGDTTKATTAAANAALNRWAMAFVGLGIGSFLLPFVGLRFELINSFVIALGSKGQTVIGILLIVLGGLCLLARSTNRTTAYSLAVALPVFAVLLYLPLAYANERDKLRPSAEAPANAAPGPSVANQSGPMSQQAIEANVAKLAKRLEENPNDAKGWTMLARSYSQMQRYKDAADAYGHATSISANDADLWADYAFAVAMINGKEMQGKPTEFINKALAIDPQNRKALVLAGDAAFALKKYDQAIQYWEKLLKTLPPNSADVAQPVTERIAEAKRLAKGTSTK